MIEPSVNPFPDTNTIQHRTPLVVGRLEYAMFTLHDALANAEAGGMNETAVDIRNIMREVSQLLSRLRR